MQVQNTYCIYIYIYRLVHKLYATCVHGVHTCTCMYHIPVDAEPELLKLNKQI